MSRVQYYVYVIELDKAFARTKKAQRANPNQDLAKPCVYVGSTSKTPEERFEQHVKAARSRKGYRIHSSVVLNHGICLMPEEFEKYNPIKTKKEALKKEIELTLELRKKGYTVWSN